MTARTVKCLARQRWATSREGNGDAPLGEPPPDGYEVGYTDKVPYGLDCLYENTWLMARERTALKITAE